MAKIAERCPQEKQCEISCQNLPSRSLLHSEVTPLLFILFLSVFMKDYLLFAHPPFSSSLSSSLHLPHPSPAVTPDTPGISSFYSLWPQRTLSEIWPVPLWQVLNDSCCPCCCFSSAEFKSLVGVQSLQMD